MAKLPSESNYIKGLEASVAKKTKKGPVVPQKQANRYAAKMGITPIQAKTRIMDNRANKTFRKAATASINVSGRLSSPGVQGGETYYNATTGEVGKTKPSALAKLDTAAYSRKYDRQKAKADVYRKRAGM